MASLHVTTAPRSVAILVFDEVEVLDFAGPFEVFSVAGRRSGLQPFQVRLVSPARLNVTARNDLRIQAHALADTVLSADVLVVPGGIGTRRLLGSRPLREWIRRIADGAEATLSVCTGALLLAEAGLLAGLRATTHHLALDELRGLDATTVVEENVRWVDNGRIITAAGVAAGIGASLHLVARLCGVDVARETADYIEYPHWTAERVAGKGIAKE
jgi:transcriptional regulator GlxA family with amidase domain